MPAPEVELRQAAYVHFTAKLLSNSFSYNDFYIRESWLPKHDALGVELDGGVLSVLSSMSDRMVMTRSRAYQHEVPLYVLFQKNLVNTQDTDEVDAYANLVHEFVETLRNDFNYGADESNLYAWLRTEFYKDSSSPSTALSPVGVRQGLFELLATVYFFRGEA